jgi:hypothetical protein
MRFSFRRQLNAEDYTDRSLFAFLAFLAGIFWWGYLAGLGLYLLLFANVKTDRELEKEREAKQQKKDAELAKLRKFARENNLPGYEEM